MKLFLYYAFCSVKNQIKKLCRTWFIIFLLICVLFGAVVGFTVGMLSDSFDPSDSGELPPADAPPEVLPPEDAVEITAEALANASNVVIGILFIVMMFLAAFSADKDGNRIFMMADANLLFPSPKRPQSVLLFKLMTKIFLTVFISFYFLGNFSELSKLGFSGASLAVAVLVWVILLVYNRIINILLYTVCSSNVRFKKYLRPVTLALLAVVGGVYALMYINTGEPVDALLKMFTSPALDYVPLFGWVKGAVAYAVLGKYIPVLIYLLLLIVCIPLLAYAVWHVKADFYEDALKGAEELEAKLEAQRTNSTAKRGRDRADRLRREGFNIGCGANVFFFKELYNRFRFGHLHFFTKTSELYLVIFAGLSLFLRFVVKTDSFMPVGLALSAFVFFRALGDPASSNVSKDFFVTIPASAHEKVLYSILAGVLTCFLDILPAAAVSWLVLGSSALEVLPLLLLAVALDLYSSSVMLFIELALPTSVALAVKQSVSIIFIYFGLAPIAVVVLVGFILELVPLFVLIGAFVAALLGALFSLFSPLFIKYGRK